MDFSNRPRSMGGRPRGLFSVTLASGVVCVCLSQVQPRVSPLLYGYFDALLSMRSRHAVIWRNLRLASGTRRRKAAKAHLCSMV